MVPRHNERDPLVDQPRKFPGAQRRNAYDDDLISCIFNKAHLLGNIARRVGFAPAQHKQAGMSNNMCFKKGIGTPNKDRQKHWSISGLKPDLGMENLAHIVCDLIG